MCEVYAALRTRPFVFRTPNLAPRTSGLNDVSAEFRVRIEETQLDLRGIRTEGVATRVADWSCGVQHREQIQ
jgi:hypothetical protein